MQVDFKATWAENRGQTSINVGFKVEWRHQTALGADVLLFIYYILSYYSLYFICFLLLIKLYVIYVFQFQF